LAVATISHINFSFFLNDYSVSIIDSFNIFNIIACRSDCACILLIFSLRFLDESFDDPLQAWQQIQRPTRQYLIRFKKEGRHTDNGCLADWLTVSIITLVIRLSPRS